MDCMKKLNYPDLVKQIEKRNGELEALRIAKEQEKEMKLTPRRVNSKTIVLSKRVDQQCMNY